MSSAISLLANATRSGTGAGTPVATDNVPMLRLSLALTAFTGGSDPVEPGRDVQTQFNVETAPATNGPWRRLTALELANQKQTHFDAVGPIPRTTPRTFVGCDAFTRATWTIRAGATVTCALTGLAFNVTEGP